MKRIQWVRKLDPELDAHLQYLYRITNEAVGKWSTVTTAYAAAAKQDITVDDVERSVASGDPSGTVDRIGWQQADETFKAASTPLIVQVLQRSGDTELNRLRLGVRFDLENPNVFQWIDTHTAELVTQVSNETRKAIRAVIRDAFETGFPPRKQAQVIRNLVGLTERDSRAVLRYWQNVASDGSRSAKAANDMADAYARKLLRRRAENIARTETINAASHGQQESWRQAGERGLLLPTTMQEWIAAVESTRTCQICLSLDSQKVPLGGTFYSPVSGQSYSGPTAHPSCRCGLAIVTEIPT